MEEDKGGIFGFGILGTRKQHYPGCRKKESTAFSQIKTLRLDLDVSEADINLTSQILDILIQVKKNHNIYQQGVKLLRAEVLERV